MTPAPTVLPSTPPPAAPPRTPLRILLVNQTTGPLALHHADVAHAVVSLRAQAVEFAHAWGLTPPEVDVAPASVVQAHADAGTVDCVLALLDTADQAGALGYHSEDSRGVKYARVFVRTCQTNHVSWTSCASHELLEALADLAVDRWVQAPDGRVWALEVSDPVESDTYVDGRGIELSSYVLPAFFDDDPPAHAAFDRLGRLTGPFTLGKGGYAVVASEGRAQQIFGDRAHYDQVEGWRHETKTTPLSRTYRRLLTVPPGATADPHG